MSERVVAELCHFLFLSLPHSSYKIATCSTIFRIPNIGANLVSLDLTYVPDRNGHGVYNLYHLVTVDLESMTKLESLSLAFTTRESHSYLDNQLARVITTLMSRGRRNSFLQPKDHHLLTPLKKLELRLPLPDGFCKHVMRGIDEGYGNHRRDVGDPPLALEELVLSGLWVEFRESAWEKFRAIPQGALENLKKLTLCSARMRLEWVPVLLK